MLLITTFQQSTQFLQQMLDIFAQFFIAPLFTESATERELNAVQNEHSKNLQSDGWRFGDWLFFFVVSKFSTCFVVFVLICADLLRRSRNQKGHPDGRFHTGDTK
jgi:hypothetical protein